jgi:predicted dehydrogenase
LVGYAPDHSKFIPVAPATLDWDLWLGVAAARAYDPGYVPFKWRGYWDFGTGALGDMGCHLMDGAFWALGLDAPTRIDAISGRANQLSAPTSSLITFHFSARAGRPAVKWTWYDGGLQPPLPDTWEAGRQFPTNGSLIVGSKATVLASTYYDSVRIVPEVRMRELAPTLPPKTLPRIEGGHFAEWLRACKGGPAAGSNFEYAAKLTELCLLSNVAVRARRPIEWDAAAMQVTNLPEANQFITKEYRRGFGV